MCRIYDYSSTTYISLGRGGYNLERETFLWNDVSYSVLNNAFHNEGAFTVVSIV